MRLILIMLFCGTCLAQISPDKKLHYMAGAITTAASYEFIYGVTKDKKKARIYSLAAGILVGSLKEAIDATQKGNRFDPHDLLATTLGGITVGITFKLFDKR